MGLHHLGQFYLSAKGVYHIPKYNSPAPLPPRYVTTFFKMRTVLLRALQINQIERPLLPEVADTMKDFTSLKRTAPSTSHQNTMA